MKHKASSILAALMLSLLLAGLASAATQSISIPITMDYPLVRSLMVKQAFTGPGESTVVLDEMGGCTFIALWEPQVTPSAAGDKLSVACRIKVRAGVPLLNKCVNTVDWEGYIELLEEVRLSPKTWQLTYATVDSKLYTRSQGEVAKVSQVIWDLVKTHVHAYIDRINLNLTPPVKDFQEFMPLVFNPGQQARVRTWLASLRPGPVKVTPTALKAELRMEVETAPPEEDESLEISQAQVERLMRAWQSYDSFLVYQISLAARYPLTQGERQTLLDTLLEARYALIARLANPARGGRDVVREQFVASWDKLSPILRRHLEKDAKRPGMSYLGYFTAADALKALDALGPTMDLDISRNGLIRLAQLLSGQDRPVDLAYSTAVDPELRRNLGLGPPLDESGPAFKETELPLPVEMMGPEPPPSDPGGEDHPPYLPPASSWLPWRWLVGTAWATEAPPGGWHEIRPWLLTRQNRELYLERIKEALRVGAQKPLNQGGAELRDAFSDLVVAAAWQESCWRQFISRGGNVTFMRSVNNTSVGLMQVNEIVWRGIYKPESLRWNVLYNIKAGVDILHLYMTKHALPQQDRLRPLPPDVLAQAVYAMYNGGPGQLNNFLKRQAKKSPSPHDRAFAAKYSWVKNEQWDKLSRCLGE